MGALIGAFPSGATLQDEWITEEITTSKTWTVPAGVTEIRVMLFGGGGGGFSNDYNRGGGGGSGYLAKGEFEVIPGSEYVITIGAGGAAGSDGGKTSFGDLLSTNGGQSGSGSAGGDGFAGGGGGAEIKDQARHEGDFGRGQVGGGGNGGASGDDTNRSGVSTLTAKGGSGDYKSGFSYQSGGGGGGMNGGDGGNGDGARGGGGGGYGPRQICQYGGKGYGAGGLGGFEGAKGICIIKYNRP